MKKHKLRENILDESLLKSKKAPSKPWSWSLRIFAICSSIFFGLIISYFYFRFQKSDPDLVHEWSPLSQSDQSEYLSWSGKHGMSIYALFATFILLITWIVALVRISRESFSERKVFIIIIGSLIAFIGLVLFLST